MVPNANAQPTRILSLVVQQALVAALAAPTREISGEDVARGQRANWTLQYL